MQSAQWPLSVDEGVNQQHGGVEYTIPLPDHVKIGGRIAEEGLEDLLHGTYSGISNPLPRPLRYFTERTLLTTHNAMADGLNHSILSKLSGVTHTFAGYGRVVYEAQERQIHYAEDADAVYALDYLQTLTPNDLPKAKPTFKVECIVMLCATYILPKASTILQGY